MARKSIDRTGHRFHSLTVLSNAGKIDGQNFHWNCRCDCGAELVVQGSNLVSGGTKSCGCHRSKRMADRNTTHGMSASSEWESWRSMRLRCTDPTNASFFRYGAVGVTVCARWMESFENFIEDMGPKPNSSYTIDRIDNALGYEPSNCRWASKSEQALNRSPRERDERGRYF